MKNLEGTETSAYEKRKKERTEIRDRDEKRSHDPNLRNAEKFARWSARPEGRKEVPETRERREQDSPRARGSHSLFPIFIFIFSLILLTLSLLVYFYSFIQLVSWILVSFAIAFVCLWKRSAHAERSGRVFCTPGPKLRTLYTEQSAKFTFFLGTPLLFSAE